MLPPQEEQQQYRKTFLRCPRDPGPTSFSHVASSSNYRLRSSGHLLNTMPVNTNSKNPATEARIANNKASITCTVDEKNNQKSICTQNKNSSRLSSTPLTFSMTTIPNANLSRLSISTENQNEADIQFLTAENQQSEKMKQHNVIKKPFFEKVSGENENILWSSASAQHTNVKTLSPNCQLPWSLPQGRELTQLPCTSQTNDFDKLVATGTIWSPSISNKNLRSIQSSLSTMSPALSTSKKIPALNSKPGASMNQTVNRNPQKEAESIYQDPLVGASNAFLLRVNEISSLEAETVRQERSRRLKKRNKLDRDSSS